MRIYADPSFLVSLLYAPDAGHPAARSFFAAHGSDEWITTEWAGFETVNSLRQLCVRYPSLSPSVPESLRRFFKHLHRHGPFQFEETDFQEALRDCHQYSTSHGDTLTMRAADVLHVALCEQLTPDLFVTRDKQQYALAVARMFNAQLVP